MTCSNGNTSIPILVYDKVTTSLSPVTHSLLSPVHLSPWPVFEPPGQLSLGQGSFLSALSYTWYALRCLENQGNRAFNGIFNSFSSCLQNPNAGLRSVRPSSGKPFSTSFASDPDQLKNARTDIEELLRTAFCHPILVYKISAIFYSSFLSMSLSVC